MNWVDKETNKFETGKLNVERREKKKSAQEILKSCHTRPNYDYNTQYNSLQKKISLTT